MSMLNNSSLIKVLNRWLIAPALLITSLAFAQTEEDPWEPLNRGIDHFNFTFDKYIFKPVAQTYDVLTPNIVDDGVSNMFGNVNDVAIAANNVLQGKVGAAASDLGRVLVNSTLGLVGFFDFASAMGLDKHEEDFGQTLATWGVGSGPYLVLPFLGPATVRDAFGRVPDGYLGYFPYVNDIPARNVAKGVEYVDLRADFLDEEELIQGDRYSFIKDVYLQRREFLIFDGVVEDDFTSEDLDDY